MNASEIPVALVAGFLSFLAPCVLPLVPGYLSAVSAVEADELGRPGTARRVVVSSIPFVLGFTAFFVLLGVGASLLPRWAEAGGRDSLRARIADPVTRAKLVADMTDNMRRRGGANSLLITSTRDTTIRGKRLDAIARERNTTPVEAALQIILAGDASVASFNMNEKDIEKFMVQPFVFTDSDGSDGHPRKYGTYPKLLRTYVYGRKILTLPQAVKRSSSAVADFFGFADRGVVRPGAFADVIVFDPKTVADKATYEEPTLLAVGMKYVLVNGRIAVDEGRYTGELSGRILIK